MTGHQRNAAIVYYSRSGHTQQLADQLASALDADVFEITVNRYCWPLVGFMRAGFESINNIRPKVADTLPDLRNYDVVAIGGPIWTSYPATPLRSILESVGPLDGKLGLFLTCGSHASQAKALALAEVDFGRPFDAKMTIPNALERSLAADDQIKGFVQTLLQDVPVKDRMRLV